LFLYDKAGTFEAEDVGSRWAFSHPKYDSGCGNLCAMVTTPSSGN